MPESTLYTIRHGKTEYTGEDLDLTCEGIAETEYLADKLKDEIGKYGEVIVITSPLARTKGTTKVFLNRLSLDCTPKVMRGIQAVDIYNLPAFLAFDDMYSTDMSGELWFCDPRLEQENNLAEGRESVNRRSIGFLRHITAWMHRRATKTGKTLCVLVFTHVEVGTNYLFPLYPGIPSKEEPEMQNSESIAISVSGSEKPKLKIQARGRSVAVEIVNGRILAINEA